MYDWQVKLFSKEKLYLAGPECFYTNGYTLWDAMRRKAEYNGFGVTMPSDNQLDMSSPDLRDHAKAIFQNCANCMNESTAILVDLENFRGAEPDGGSIYELGMAYARGMRCYAYTRDKRALTWKVQGAHLNNGVVCGPNNSPLPYAELPFAPAIVGACKVIDGDFDDCLNLFMTELNEECKNETLGIKIQPKPILPAVAHEKPLVYLAGFERYDEDAAEKYNEMKAVCAKYGFDAVAPIDMVRNDIVVDTDNPYEIAAQLFNRYQQHVRDCDIVLANLNDFRGYEPSNDVSFECGMGYQLGKKLFGYMDNVTRMKERIPNYGEAREFRDECGRNAENFDYPINLMFSGSMPIFEKTSFEAVVKQMAEALK